MKKLTATIAALVIAPALAFAEGDKSQPGSMDQGQMDQGSMDQGQMGQQEMPEGTQQLASYETFKGQQNYKVKGTIESVDMQGQKITLQREKNLPPIELSVMQDAKIKMDGKTATLTELQPGAEVRATFNVAEDQVVAIELDAKKGKMMKQKGTMQPGTTQPGTTQPGTTQPGTTQPGGTQNY